MAQIRNWKKKAIARVEEVKLRAHDDKRMAREAKRRAISEAVDQFEADKRELKREKHELKVNEREEKFAGVCCRCAGNIAGLRTGILGNTSTPLGRSGFGFFAEVPPQKEASPSQA